MQNESAMAGSGREFMPGFRIDTVDVLVLAAGAAASALAAQVQWWMGALIAFAVGHFFLFCNVLRMARPLELAWAGLFVALAASTIATSRPGWAIAFGGSLLATVAVIALQMGRPSYHGIAWQRINPGLRNWWAEHGGSAGEGPRR